VGTAHQPRLTHDRHLNAYVAALDAAQPCPERLAQAAHAAFLREASTSAGPSIRYTDRRTEKFDLRYEGGAARGTFTVNGVTIHIITVGHRACLKADQHGWQAVGNPDTQNLPVNRWIRSGRPSRCSPRSRWLHWPPS
jgi:hypothetical protein